MTNISVSKVDNPISDMGMVARNPENHEDQWYIAKQYFKDNFEEISTTIVPKRTFWTKWY